MTFWHYFIKDIEKLIRHEARMMGLKINSRSARYLSLKAYYHIVRSETSADNAEKQLIENFNELISYIQSQLLTIYGQFSISRSLNYLGDFDAG
ncbi:MAG: hypothetical protein ACP5GU_00675 [Thermoprotei archaeon]|jgi:hypothetical protein